MDLDVRLSVHRDSSKQTVEPAIPERLRMKMHIFLLAGPDPAEVGSR